MRYINERITSMHTNGTHESQAKLSRLFRGAEAAKYLNISPRHLWTLTKRGEIPRIKMGRIVRYDVNALAQYVSQRQVRSTEDN